MFFHQIAGQAEVVSSLQASIREGRVSQATLLSGKNGYGTLALALAYAAEIFSKDNPEAAQRAAKLSHVDVHLSYPYFLAEKQKTSEAFQRVFREKILEDAYLSMEDWAEAIGGKNKNILISVDEIERLLNTFSLSSYEGGAKVLIIWGIDYMNTDASNKFLKFLEEPPADTYLILTTERPENLLDTIRSRCQEIKINRVSDADLLKFAVSLGFSEEEIAPKIPMAEGDVSVLKNLLLHREDEELEELFIRWVRSAFMVVKKTSEVEQLILLAQLLADRDKVFQNKFLNYASQIFRSALLQSYGSEEIFVTKIDGTHFNWPAFSGYIHGNNVPEILEELSLASYHLSRNANPKIIWTDLCLKLTRLLHKKKS